MTDTDTDVSKEVQEHTEKILCPECGQPVKVPAGQSLSDVHKKHLEDESAPDGTSATRNTQTRAKADARSR